MQDLYYRIYPRIERVKHNIEVCRVNVKMRRESDVDGHVISLQVQAGVVE